MPKNAQPDDGVKKPTKRAWPFVCQGLTRCPPETAGSISLYMADGKEDGILIGSFAPYFPKHETPEVKEVIPISVLGTTTTSKKNVKAKKTPSKVAAKQPRDFFAAHPTNRAAADEDDDSQYSSNEGNDELDYDEENYEDHEDRDEDDKKSDELTNKLEDYIDICDWENGECRERFEDSKEFDEHVIKHAKASTPIDGKFYCSYKGCKKVHKKTGEGIGFTTKENLKNHLYTHTKNRIPCGDHCEETFKSAETRARHLRKAKKQQASGEKRQPHSDDRNMDFAPEAKKRQASVEKCQPHCNDCNMDFANKYNFKKHVKAVHQNLRPFKCTVSGCDKKFKEKYQLDAHSRTHGDPVKCPKCHKDYTTKESLAQHLKNFHQKETKYKCEECGKELANSSNLKRHLKDSHKIYD